MLIFNCILSPSQSVYYVYYNLHINKMEYVHEIIYEVIHENNN